MQLQVPGLLPPGFCRAVSRPGKHAAGKGASRCVRRRRILQRVAEEQTIKIGELARELDVSEMTIRRDISRLEQDGFLRHTHGGATAHITKSIELTFNARALEYAAEKRLIGMRAAGELASPSA